MSVTESMVLYREERHVGIITVNRPEKLNALNPAVFDQLEAAIDRLEASTDVAVGVVTGAGRAFIAGADIGHYVDLSIHQYRDFMTRGRACQDRLVHSPKLLIAAVEGYALGGGFEIALCCDLIVAGRDAQFGLPEIKLGLLPGGGGTQRLARFVGQRRTIDLLVTGRTATAAEVESWGLVNRLVEAGDALEAAVELGEKVSRRAPVAVRLAKRLVREGLGADLETALTLEHAETAALYLTDDASEGIQAFLQKRRPSFAGR